MENLFSILLFGAFFYLMMRYGCGAHMSHGHSGHGSHGKHTANEGTVSPSKDPVCGMLVSGETGYSKTIDGHEYRFCSRQCLDQFEVNPQRYAA